MSDHEGSSKPKSTVGNRIPHHNIYHTSTEPKYYVTRRRIVRYLVDVSGGKYTSEACKERGDSQVVLLTDSTLGTTIRKRYDLDGNFINGLSAKQYFRVKLKK